MIINMLKVYVGLLWFTLLVYFYKLHSITHYIKYIIYICNTKQLENGTT